MLNKDKKIKVLVFGTFDLLHPGHRYFLKQAKQRGDYLVVVVARDENVKKIKGKLPKDSEKKRKQNLEALNYIDEVYLGHRDLRKKQKLLKKIKPDIVCLGYDQEVNFRSKCVDVEKIKSFHPNKYKSSLLSN